MASLSNLRFSWDKKKESEPAEDPLLEALPTPAAVLDANGIIRAVNSRWPQNEPTALPGESYLHFCERLHGSDPDCSSDTGAGIRSVLSGRSPSFRCECAVVSEPKVRVLRITAVPHRADFGSGALLLCEPVQPSRRDDDQSRQAQKMETVGRLVGGVAHDFANLLTLIAGYSELLLKRMPGDHELRPELEEIHSAASRGSRLTSQLLGFSRGQSVEPRLLDLNQLVGDLERMLRPIIGEYIEIETHLAPDAGSIVADPGQMEQVIMNLVLNARDAMPSGGRITISTEPHEVTPAEALEHGAQSGPAVQLTIADTGHGMGAETLGRLFEPFFTTKEKGKGTGLGLNTVYKIVKQNRGDIWASSKPGEGAVFTLWLPRARQAAEDKNPGDSRRSAPGGGGESILLVEDEESVRRLLAHILSKRGYRVLEAAGGDEALAIFTEHGDSIQLLLTDMVMPRMSGREVAERLCAIRPDLAVIYMSGYTDDVLLRTGALRPGMSFLQKPLRPDTLATRVREALDARPAANTAG